VVTARRRTGALINHRLAKIEMSDVTLVADDKKNGIFNMQPWTKLKKNLTNKQKVVAARLPCRYHA
jgi:hypothetical protein